MSDPPTPPGTDENQPHRPGVSRTLQENVERTLEHEESLRRARQQKNEEPESDSERVRKRI